MGHRWCTTIQTSAAPLPSRQAPLFAPLTRSLQTRESPTPACTLWASRTLTCLRWATPCSSRGCWSSERSPTGQGSLTSRASSYALSGPSLACSLGTAGSAAGPTSAWPRAGGRATWKVSEQCGTLAARERRERKEGTAAAWRSRSRKKVLLLHRHRRSRKEGAAAASAPSLAQRRCCCCIGTVARAKKVLLLHRPRRPDPPSPPPPPPSPPPRLPASRVAKTSSLGTCLAGATLAASGATACR
jgi:hypothetical protein